ncbi:Methylenetetrahydrofolate--tRNA-(uracil-5-)-methyltransferase TrmFO [compost metagenome]
MLHFPETTMLGSLSKYISTENKNYQPMNANFGIIKPLDIKGKIKDKKVKYEMYANRSIEDLNEFKENLI